MLLRSERWVTNGPEGAAAVRGQDRRERPCHAEQPERVHVEHRLDLPKVAGDERCGRHDARVVEDDVDLAVVGHDSVGVIENRLTLCDVEQLGVHRCAGGRERGNLFADNGIGRKFRGELLGETARYDERLRAVRQRHVADQPRHPAAHARAVQLEWQDGIVPGEL